MNHKEAVVCYRKIFVAFPSYSEWLNRQDDPIATLDAWCRLLKHCESTDVEHIVDQLLDGTFNPRDKYDKIDTLPLIIRGRAMRLKEDRERFAATNKVASDSDERRKDRGHVHSMPNLFAEVRKNNLSVKDGKMTAEERDELLLDIRRRARLKR